MPPFCRDQLQTFNHSVLSKMWTGAIRQHGQADCRISIKGKSIVSRGWTDLRVDQLARRSARQAT